MALHECISQEVHFLFRAHASHTGSWLCISLYSSWQNVVYTSPQTWASWGGIHVPPSSWNAHGEVHTACSIEYCSFLIELWLLDHKDLRSNSNDYPHASGPWGQTQDHARICTRCPLPVSILWWYPMSSYTSASPSTPEQEWYLLFLFGTYSYFPTKCFVSFLLLQQ